MAGAIMRVNIEIRGTSVIVIISVIFVICILAAISFPIICEYENPETLSRSKGVVKRLSGIKYEWITEITLGWLHKQPGQEHTEYVEIKFNRDNPRELRDLQLLYRSLKTMSVDKHVRRDVWRGDKVIIYFNRGMKGVDIEKLSIQGIGFENPSPYIGPTLRSETLGPLVRRIYHERKENQNQ